MLKGMAQRLRRDPARSRLLVAALVTAVVAGAGTTWMATSRAARTTNIGYVDLDRVLEEYLPPTLEEPLRQETARLQAEFDEKSKGLKDEEKQKLFSQYQQRLEQRKQELINAQLPKVRSAIAAVAQEQNLDLVIHGAAVLWGGQDITPQVLARLGIKSASAQPNAGGGK